jgi:hypothetical protein
LWLDLQLPAMADPQAALDEVVAQANEVLKENVAR